MTQKDKKKKVLYKFIGETNKNTDVATITCNEYKIFKEDDKGYSVYGNGFIDSAMEVWIAKTGEGRWLFDTKEEALSDFIKQQTKELVRLEKQIETIQGYIDIAKTCKY